MANKNNMTNPEPTLDGSQILNPAGSSGTATSDQEALGQERKQLAQEQDELEKQRAELEAERKKWEDEMAKKSVSPVPVADSPRRIPDNVFRMEHSNGRTTLVSDSIQAFPFIRAGYRCKAKNISDWLRDMQEKADQKNAGTM